LRHLLFRHHPSINRQLPLHLALVVGAIGVVYGDIGTSPLYAVNQAFYGIGQTPITHDNVLGVIGLIFWLLTIVVSIKYMFIILNASYQGEGGVFALHEMLAKIKSKQTVIFMMMLVFASCLLLGDGIITPAISVLSAVEGLQVTTTLFQPYIVTITAVILTLLFAIQHKGTSKVGILFGPIMIIWFFTIGLLGLVEVLREPGILAALNPLYAIRFALGIGYYHFALAIAAITLSVTGAEALYADLGHFGTYPIRAGWFTLAYWSLVLNYLGQGAFLLSGKLVVNHNIFYSLLPHITINNTLTRSLPIWLAAMLTHSPVLFMVILATLATIIASQALITGAFSLVSQAIALGIAPRLNIVHTNHKREGQIYLPVVNWTLYVGCLVLVLIFQSSDKLAAAYGLAVSGVMVSTSFPMFLITRNMWKWPLIKTFLIIGTLLAIDLTLFSTNTLKFMTGGYVPVAISIFLFSIFITWQWGRRFISSAYTGYIYFAAQHSIIWLADLKNRLKKDGRIQYRARQLVEQDRAVVFLISKPVEDITDHVPIIIRIYIKRQGSLPKYLIMLNISQEKKPFIDPKECIEVKDFGENIYSVKAHFGFMQQPDGFAVLRTLKASKIFGDLHRCTIEAAEDELFINKNASLINKIRVKIYHFIDYISPHAYHYFGLDSRPGLAKTIIPIVLGKNGWRIDLPEFALEQDEELIDPDTREQTDLQFIYPLGHMVFKTYLGLVRTKLLFHKVAALKHMQPIQKRQ